MVNRIMGDSGIPSEMPAKDVEKGVRQEGLFEGKTVTVEEDAVSMIADAAEELTFEAAETVEKKVEERRVEKERPSELIQRIYKLQEMLPDFDEGKFRMVIKRMHQKPPGSASELRSLLQEHFPDVSHEHAALSLIEEFSQDNPKLMALAKEARVELETKAGSAIRAGMNISSVASEYAAEGLGEISDLRNFYRDTVLQYEGVTETFRSITERFPNESLLDAVAYLIKAVGNDLHARGPSIEPEELRTILNDLYHLESIANLNRSFDQLLKRTTQGFAIMPSLDSVGLLGEFLTLKDKQWIAESDVLAVVNKIGIKDPSARIYFLQGFVNIVRDAPLKIFPSDEGRLALIAKIQEALDRAIEEE